MMSGHAKAEFPTGPSGPGPQVIVDDAEFQRWVKLLEQRTGMVVAENRRQFLESNLRRRLSELGYNSLARYQAEQLTGPRGAVEWAVLVDRLTVHETRFFRHPPSLALLRERILPEFVKRAEADQEFHAWSVGCATGEEPYTLAMIIDRFARESQARHQRPFRYAVTGSDVSRPALKAATEASYPQARQDEIPNVYRSYCQPHASGGFTLGAALRARVNFAALNLLEVDRQPMSGLELIYCQNVLIYFPRARRHEFLDHLIASLRPGGCLIIGPGEVTTWHHPQVQRIEDRRALVYRRV
ncbi:MAG: CheR family methyltransferase [Pseudomonadota bacterium]